MGSAAVDAAAGALSKSALLMLCARTIGSVPAAHEDGGTDAGLSAARARSGLFACEIWVECCCKSHNWRHLVRAKLCAGLFGVHCHGFRSVCYWLDIKQRFPVP